jgi:branched-chain amino acid transport system substrate-binding protein
VVCTWPRQAQAAAQFAFDDLQATQAAILTTANLDYSATLADTFGQQFTALNGDIVYQQNIPADDGALAGTLTAIAETGAALIYLPVEANTAQRVAAQLKTLGLNNIILLGSDSWDSPDLDHTIMAGSYYPAHFALDNENPVVTTWGEAYKTIYAIEPDTLAVLSYDAAVILLRAIEETNSLDPVQVSNTLTQTTFESITGPIYFD